MFNMQLNDILNYSLMLLSYLLSVYHAIILLQDVAMKFPEWFYSVT